MGKWEDRLLTERPGAKEQSCVVCAECEGGPLANNVGYRWLKGHMTGGPLYCLGQWVNYQVQAEVAGVKVAQTVEFCVVGITRNMRGQIVRRRVEA